MYAEANVDGRALFYLGNPESDFPLLAGKITKGAAMRFAYNVSLLNSLDNQFEIFFPNSPSRMERGDLTIQADMSSVTVKLQMLFFQQRSIKASIVAFKRRHDENHYAFARAAQREKAPSPDFGVHEAYQVISLWRTRLSSYSESGSDGIPNVNAAFQLPSNSDGGRFEMHFRGLLDWETLGSQIMATLVPKSPLYADLRQRKEVDPYSMVCSQSLIQTQDGKYVLLQHGQCMVWSREVHRFFPEEFRSTTRALVFILRVPRTSPTGKMIANDVINLILRYLARTYTTVRSPLDVFPYPRGKEQKEIAEKEEINPPPFF